MGLFDFLQRFHSTPKKSIAQKEFESVLDKADQGDAIAMEKLVYIYKSGEVVVDGSDDYDYGETAELFPPDYCKAYEWAVKLKDTKHSALTEDVYRLIIDDLKYLSVLSFKQHRFSTAKKYADILIKECEAEGFYVMSQFYKNGCIDVDITADADKYIEYLKKAAELGFDTATEELNEQD